MDPVLIYCPIVAGIVVALAFLLNSIVFVPEKHCAVSTTFGKFDRVLSGGFHFLYPWQRLAKVRWTSSEKVILESTAIPLYPIELDIPPVEVLTSDKYTCYLDTRIKIRVANPREAIVPARNLFFYAEKDIINCLQKYAAAAKYESLMNHEYQFGQEVKKVIGQNAHDTGLELASFHLENVQPSKSLADTQKKVMQAKLQLEAKSAAAETEQEVLAKELRLQEQALIAKMAMKYREHEERLKRRSASRKADLEARENEMEQRRKHIQSMIQSGVPESVINNAIASDTLTDMAYAGTTHLFTQSDIQSAGVLGMMKSTIPYGSYRGAGIPYANPASSS